MPLLDLCLLVETDEETEEDTVEATREFEISRPDRPDKVRFFKTRGFWKLHD